MCSDRGGNIMNLISSVLVYPKHEKYEKINKSNDKRVVDDYGYYLYNSLEYNKKYIKSNDFGYKASILNINIK